MSEEISTEQQVAADQAATSAYFAEARRLLDSSDGTFASRIEDSLLQVANGIGKLSQRVNRLTDRVLSDPGLVEMHHVPDARDSGPGGVDLSAHSSSSCGCGDPTVGNRAAGVADRDASGEGGQS